MDEQGLTDQLVQKFPDVEHSINERPDTIHVGMVRVPEDRRGQGMGTQFMNHIIDYSKEKNKPVFLTPEKIGGQSTAALDRWYKSLGFKPNKGRAKDYRSTASRVREPKADGGDVDQPITAYHGSPHQIGDEGFSNERIGTGTGAQAYGHGHYFNETEPVAQSYRDDLSSQKAMVEGQKSYGNESPAHEILSESNWDIDKAIENAHNHLHHFTHVERSASRINLLNEAIAQLNNWKNKSSVQKNTGHMYEVAIHAHPDHFLDWDKPLHEQSEHVKNAMSERSGLFEKGSSYTGKDLYRIFEDMHGDDSEKASNELRNKGIYGVKYFGDMYRSGLKKPTQNYVVFDPKDIEIKRRYAEGGYIHKGGSGEIDQPTTAYHGSPHDFDEFDTSKIGTGEGAQAYGHGLYFAESEPTAKYYKDTLAHRGQIDLEHEANQREMPMSREAMIEVRRHANGSVDPLEAAKHMHWSSIEARQYPQEKLADLIDLYRKAKQGHMYEVAIDAHPDHFLDWDKPLSEQSDHIVKSIFDARKDNPTLFNVFKPHLEKDSTGMGFYQSLATQHPNGYQGATDFLQRAGIHGIRYLDAGSRNAQGDPTHNYVVFDHNRVSVKRKYAQGGDVEGYGRGGSPEDDIIRQRLAAIPSIDHPDPAMREKALGIAQGTHRLNPLYETGEKNKRVGHSFYTYKGGQEDPSNVQSTVIPIPGVTPLTPKKMSYEEFYKQGQGGTFINLGGDRSRLGRLTHIDNKQLAWPVDLHAGPQYMLEPNKGAVWANAAGQTTRNKNIIEPLLKKGPVYGMYTPMGPLTVDSSFQMTDAIMSQIGASKLDKKAAKAFDENIKKANFVGGKRPEDIENRKKIAEAMKGWPGINNAWEAKEYLKNIPGTIRSLIVKDLDRSDWQQMGFPHVGKTKVAITDPDLLNVGGNMIGHRVVQLSPDRVMPTAFKHNTYPEETAGTYVGDVPLVQRHYALPEAINQFAAEPHKPGVLHPYSENPNAQGGFKKMTEDQKVIQNIDKPWLESVQQGLANQSKYGFATGGSIRTPYQKGGKVEGSIWHEKDAYGVAHGGSIAKTLQHVHNPAIVEHALNKVGAALPALDPSLMAAKAGRRY